ncbi:putative OsmC like protein [Trypanosoma vivax]|uniref:OsmC-like protein n=1 Tax=Trypanosoma vivax (strain Y486) TaxID=1055687 RepID=G0TUH9_TRYVY|nr:putative OsmC like protein [Trypanosoma vivax]CCC47613.1 conserved hypothetical protein [Trypanosoma vivax Y486]
MRCTGRRHGVWKVFYSELLKTPAYLFSRVKTSAESLAGSLNEVMGANMEESPAAATKRREHRKLYEQLLYRKQREEAQKAKEELKKLSFSERFRATVTAFATSLKEATATNAGFMLLLQHCTASHAAEVAVEQGIDLKNVTLQVEKRKAASQVGSETVVVGYIDAPNASEEEIMAFAEKIQKRCPMANAMHERIEWRVAGTTTGGNNHEDNLPDSCRGNGPGEGVAFSSSKSISESHHFSERNTTKVSDTIDEDELHIPGLHKRNDKKREE